MFNLGPRKQRANYFALNLIALVSMLAVYIGIAQAGQNTDNLIDEDGSKQYGDLLDRWNGAIFWAPASGFTSSDHWSNLFGDEARSVFGPLPEINCADPVGVPFRAEYQGKPVTDEMLDLFLASNDADDKALGESASASSEPETQCDKPSLANTGGRHACGTNSRISYFNNLENSNVDWVVLCRKGTYGGFFYDADYWSDHSKDFALLGIIGFNSSTGEVVFFDGTDKSYGRKLPLIFSWRHKYPPPGGFGYQDPDRWVSTEIYDYGSQLRCEGCHDNKEPWIITPHLKRRGFGYRDAELENRLALNIQLPLVQPRTDEAPYRVIGTRYTRFADLTSKTFRDPTGSCTYCHTLTTDWTGSVLAYDAVGKKNPNEPYRSFFERVEKSRTEWAKKEHNTHPWMVPWLGPNVKPNVETGWVPSAIDDANWERIAACINETSKEDCGYRPVYTSCPAPESSQLECSREDEQNNNCSRLADPFGPSQMSTQTLPFDGASDPISNFERKTAVSWTYLNGLGDVPQRDDVRFNLAIREVDIPADAGLPGQEEFPDRQASSDPYFSHPHRKGRIHYCDMGARRLKTCHVLNPDRGEFLINNISHAGHVRNTTPEPAFSPRQYRVVIPTRCNKRYLARLVPKRFCFDRSGVLASSVDHLAYFDVRCDAE